LTAASGSSEKVILTYSLLHHEIITDKKTLGPLASFYFDDQTVLQAALAYQQATHWHQKHPD